MGVMNSHTLERLWWEPPGLEIERQIMSNQAITCSNIIHEHRHTLKAK